MGLMVLLLFHRYHWFRFKGSIGVYILVYLYMSWIEYTNTPLHQQLIY